MNFTAVDVTRAFKDILTPAERRQRLEEGHTNSKDRVYVLSEKLSTENLADLCQCPTYSILTSFGSGGRLHSGTSELD